MLPSEHAAEEVELLLGRDHEVAVGPGELALERVAAEADLRELLAHPLLADQPRGAAVEPEHGGFIEESSV
jgi:hypothetical protein